MNITKYIQLTLLIIECCSALFYGYIIIRLRYARIASNINIPKLWRSINTCTFTFVIACVAFMLLSLTIFSS